MKNLTKVQQQALRVLRRRCAFEDASFGFKCEQVTCSDLLGRQTTVDKDTFIKRESQIYRETWVLPILDAMIDGDTGLLRSLVEG